MPGLMDSATITFHSKWLRESNPGRLHISHWSRRLQPGIAGSAPALMGDYSGKDRRKGVHGGPWKLCRGCCGFTIESLMINDVQGMAFELRFQRPVTE
jgi:hypothetical protein